MVESDAGKRPGPPARGCALDGAPVARHLGLAQPPHDRGPASGRGHEATKHRYEQNQKNEVDTLKAP